MTIIDQYNGDPTYATLHVLTRDNPETREMLKTASFEGSKETIEDLPSTAFAWEDERRFPVHTKADTVASLLYRSKCGSAVPEHVDEKLIKAAKVYELPRELFAHRKEAQAKSIEEYALPEEERLPLDDVAQIKIAEFVLNRDYTKLPLVKRADAYSRVYQAAQRHGVELGMQTKKMAGATLCSTKVLVDWLEARAAATGVKHAESFDKLACAVRQGPDFIRDRKTLTKVANTIAELDKAADLTKHYDRKLPDPLQTVFNTEKIAMLTCDVAGRQIDCQELMNLPPEIWEQVDMPELAEVAATGDEVQFKQVFDTVPMDIKMVLGQQLGNA